MLTFYLFLILLKPFVESGWKCIAVVEYQAIDSKILTPEERLTRNAQEYIRILDRLSKNHVSVNIAVIIFPEETLDQVKTEKDVDKSGVEIKSLQNPCTTHSKNYPKYLQDLSCAAIKYQTTIVLNLVEKYDYSYYSSDVVLNILGIIQFSIRRENRIGIEHLSNDPVAFAIPARTIFYLVEMISKEIAIIIPFTPTSFVTGFSFSFDKVISLREYRGYVVCSNWISQLPFLTSLQVYQMWAQEYNITLFFSGANNPKRGQGGTGIYHAAAGPLLMDTVSFGGSKAYVYNFSDSHEPGYIMNLPPNKSIDEVAKEMEDFYLEVDPDLYRYESRLVDPLNSQIVNVICYNKTHNNYFCCEFSLHLSYNFKLKARKQYFYHLVAYKGYKTYYDIFEPGGVEVCAVIACLDSSISSCGRRFDNYHEIGWPLTFRKIVVKAKFRLPLKEKIYYSMQFPNSLLSSIRPIHPNFTNWSQETVTDGNNSFLRRTFSLIQAQDRILTFGIFGRNFTLEDPRLEYTGRTGKLHFWIILVFLNFSIIVLL